MQPRPDVLVVGRSCLDTLAVVEAYPREDTKAPLESRILEGGGQGGTASACIARLGGKVLYVGRVGDDDEGRFCLRRLRDFGVDTAFVDQVKGGRTPAAFIFVTRPTGKRTIFYEKNALPRLYISDLKPALACRPRVLLLDPETTYLAGALKPRFLHGARIVYDCERWRDGMEAMMASADFFIPSAPFLDSGRLGLEGMGFAEKMLRLNTRLKGALVVTKGAQGAYYLEGGTLFRVLAPKLPVKDTTGAGDNFHAAFALAVSRGQALHEAVCFSVAVASLSCREYGGRNGIPEIEEAERLAQRLETRRL